MKTYNYTVSTNTIWTSFDHGTVQANSLEEARSKALEELKYNFKKANDAFDHCDVTQGFVVDFDETQIQVKEKKLGTV